jgi:[acyl-carrier-protein] S-malonyltransferase
MQYVFLFPGQGSQHVGMGQYLLEQGIGKDTFEQANQALGQDLTKLMLEGPEEQLQHTANAQPAILTVAVAIGRYLMANGIQPEKMAGHSLGEYACLVLSNALAFEDAVKAVHQRGQFMQDAVPLGVGTMAAILGAEDKLVEEVCAQVTDEGELVEAANYNCPGQLVISGTVVGVEKASQLLKEKGAKRCVPLAVSAPFHSSMLKPASDNMAVVLETIALQHPDIPYIANVDVGTVTQSDQIKQRLVDQIHNPVRWTQTLQALIAQYPQATFVEVGAAKVVSGHVKKVDRNIATATTDTIEALNSLIDS